MKKHLLKTHNVKPFTWCHLCHLELNSARELKKHFSDIDIHSISKPKRIDNIQICDQCGKRFSRKWTLNQHSKNVHGGENAILYNCEFCKISFADVKKYRDHIRNVHKASKYFKLISKTSGLGNIVRHYVHTAKSRSIEFLNSECELKRIMAVVKKAILLTQNCKIQIAIRCQMFLPGKFEDGEYPSIEGQLDNVLPYNAKQEFNFTSKAGSYTNTDTSKQIRSKLKTSIKEVMEIYERTCSDEGSGWILSSFESVHLKVIKILPPLLIGSGDADFDIKSIPGRLQLVNVPGKNHKCFLYCIIFHLYFKTKEESLLFTTRKNTKEKALYQYERLLNEQKWNLDGISFPISFTEIEKFFRQNETLKITNNIYQLSRSLDFAQESKFSLINVFHHNAG